MPISYRQTNTLGLCDYNRVIIGSNSEDFNTDPRAVYFVGSTDISNYPQEGEKNDK